MGPSLTASHRLSLTLYAPAFRREQALPNLTRLVIVWAAPNAECFSWFSDLLSQAEQFYARQAGSATLVIQLYTTR